MEKNNLFVLAPLEFLPDYTLKIVSVTLVKLLLNKIQKYVSNVVGTNICGKYLSCE